MLPALPVHIPYLWSKVDSVLRLSLFSVRPFASKCCAERLKKKLIWAVLSDEQMSKGWPFSLLNDEQMSNLVGGGSHQPVMMLM